MSLHAGPRTHEARRRMARVIDVVGALGRATRAHRACSGKRERGAKRPYCQLRASIAADSERLNAAANAH